jgi:hypothetical protein
MNTTAFLSALIATSLFVSSAAAQDAVSHNAAAKQEHPSEYTGLTLRGATYLATMAGQPAVGIPSPRLGIGLDLGVALAVSRHFAIEAGVLLSAHTISDCDGCSFGKRSLPTRLEYAFDSRKSGAYVSGGIAWLQAGRIGAGKEGVEIGTFYATAGAIGSLGYRLPMPVKDVATSSEYRSPVRTIIDMRLQVQRWTFDEISVPNQGRGLVNSNMQSAQYEVSLAIGIGLTP